jgi:hypothetical protein
MHCYAESTRRGRGTQGISPRSTASPRRACRHGILRVTFYILLGSGLEMLLNPSIIFFNTS